MTTARMWEDFSFVVSSGYRERVLGLLAEAPKLPKQLAQETNLRLNHVSRALRELGQRGLVVCLTPAAKARGRLYGVTDTGSSLLAYLRNSRRRFVPPSTAPAGVFGFVPKVRASSVIRLLEFLEEKNGNAAAHAAIRTWSVNPVDLTEDTWLSADACAELLELVESKFGDGSYGYIRSTFSEAIASFPSVREQLAKALPLETLAEMSPILYAKEWNFGRLEVETGRRRAVFRHFDWMPTPAMCSMYHGIYEGILRFRGFQGKVTKTRCVRRGDDRCEYVVEW